MESVFKDDWNRQCGCPLSPTDILTQFCRSLFFIGNHFDVNVANWGERNTFMVIYNAGNCWGNNMEALTAKYALPKLPQGSHLVNLRSPFAKLPPTSQCSDLLYVTTSQIYITYIIFGLGDPPHYFINLI